MNNCIAVIPARGGSKRIHRKNIKNFSGKPMISWVIKELLNASIFDDIVVSTEDTEIANIAMSYGATCVVDRPRDLADDHTPTVPVIAHSIEYLNKVGVYPEFVCCVYPCAPLICKNDLIDGLKIIKSNNTDYVYPITEYPHPTQRALRVDEYGKIEFVSPKYELTRTQDLETTYHDAGQFYWGRCSSWLAQIRMHSNGIGMPIPNWRVVDIDTDDDWVRSEIVFNQIVKMK